MYSPTNVPKIKEDVYVFEFEDLYNVYKSIVFPHCDLSWFGFDIKNLLGNLLIEALHVRPERVVDSCALNQYLPTDVLVCFIKQIGHYADGVSRIAHESLRDKNLIISYYSIENKKLLVHTTQYIYEPNLKEQLWQI